MLLITKYKDCFSPYINVSYMSARSQTKFHTSIFKGALVVTIMTEPNSESREAAMLFHILQKQKVRGRRLRI
jgi:hypothetical protein